MHIVVPAHRFRECWLTACSDHVHVWRVTTQALFTTPLESDNGKSFFAALHRVEAIRVECKQLISSALQSAGIEILEDMARHQEAAFDRLFKWVQEQCQTLTQDAPDFDSGDRDVQPLLRAALKVLSARPSYLKYDVVLQCP